MQYYNPHFFYGPPCILICNLVYEIIKYFSASTETNTIQKPFEIEIKDAKNKEQSIDLLTQPVNTVNSNISAEPSSMTETSLSGILYGLAGSIIFTASVFIIKQLKVDLIDVLILRSLVHTLMLFIYIKFIKQYSLFRQSKKKEILFLFIVGFVAATGYLSFFLAYRYLSLPDVITIRYTQIIWTLVITTILYHERPSIATILSICLTIAGIVCVAQPNTLFTKTFNATKTNISNDNNQYLIGSLLALYCSIALSIMVIANKYLLVRYKTRHSLIMLYCSFMCLWMIIGNLLYKYNFFIDKAQTFKNDIFNWNFFCGSLVSLLHIISIAFVQKSIKRIHPSIFTTIQSSNILFSILLQNIFSSLKSNLLSLIGSALILTSNLVITGHAFLHEKQDKNNQTQICVTE